MTELHPDWITHRLPTAADADDDGDVRIPLSVDAAMNGPERSLTELDWAWARHDLIVPGQLWWSKKAAAAPTPSAAPPAPAPTRKVVQIAVTPNTPEKKTTLYALCSDSTIWWVSDYSASWTQIPAVPQPGDQ
jgi:hypothetical protein